MEGVRSRRVQSVGRAFDVLEALADAGGSATLSELSGATRLPLPTVHRIVRSMVTTGYVWQEPSRRYALGPQLIRLGETAARMLGSWAVPHLTGLVAEFGETANMAMLEGDTVVYVAQVPSAHSMRTFIEVGRRVLPHCTGVGKALLAVRPDDQVRAILHRTGMPAQTEHTITTPDVLLAELRRIRQRGYAVDNAEQDLGVRCVAVPVERALAGVAISVSGPSVRVTPERVRQIAPELQRVAAELVEDFGATRGGTASQRSAEN